MKQHQPGQLVHEAQTRSIIAGFYETYNHLGFGYRESVYAAALERELIARGHRVAREVNVRVYYKGDAIAWERLDMLVDDCVIVECKASEILPPSAFMQLNTYLGSTWVEVGLLLHYGMSPRFYRRHWPNERKARTRALSAEADEGRPARVRETAAHTIIGTSPTCQEPRPYPSSRQCVTLGTPFGGDAQKTPPSDHCPVPITRGENTMNEWNEKSQKEAAEKVFRMATSNPEFRKLALTDARAAVKKATGKELPNGFKLRFVDPAGAHMTVVLPRAASEAGELSEYELVAVAGGKGGGGTPRGGGSADGIPGPEEASRTDTMPGAGGGTGAM